MNLLQLRFLVTLFTNSSNMRTNLDTSYLTIESSRLMTDLMGDVCDLDHRHSHLCSHDNQSGEGILLSIMTWLIPASPFIPLYHYPNHPYWRINILRIGKWRRYFLQSSPRGTPQKASYRTLLPHNLLGKIRWLGHCNTASISEFDSPRWPSWRRNSSWPLRC